MNYGRLFALALMTVLAAGNSASAGFGAKLDKLVKDKLKPRTRTTQKAEPAAKPAPTCNAVNSLGVCYSFAGPKNSEEKSRKGNELGCKFMKGRFLASDTCPAAKAMGKCVIKAGQPEEYTLYYYQGGRLSRRDAEKDCANSKSGIHAQGAGKWTAL